MDVTVIFEAKGASSQGIKFDWNDDRKIKFKCIHLSEEDIHEKKDILIRGAVGYFSPSAFTNKYLAYYSANIRKIYRKY